MNLSNLPHKNLYLSGAIAFIIIGTGVFMQYNPSFFSKLNEEKNSVLTPSSNTKNTSIDSRDSDEDGLPDWEEALYASDPFKKDTDGDGTLDGDEVRMGRNPIIANTSLEGESPTDLLPVVQDPTFSTSSTYLSEAKKEFLKKFLTTAGQEVRETTYRDIISKFDATKFKPNRQLVDLNISSDNSDSDFKRFINDFGAVILRYKTPSAPRSETEILNEYAETQNEQLLRDLRLNVLGYTNLARDLRNIPTPSGIAKIYLSLVVGYEGMGLSLSGLEQLKTNPVDAAGGYEGYMLYQTRVADGYAAIVSEVGKRGITFTPDETGYMFYVNIFQ